MPQPVGLPPGDNTSLVMVGATIRSPLSGTYPQTVLAVPLAVDERSSIPNNAFNRLSALNALLNWILF